MTTANIAPVTQAWDHQIALPASLKDRHEHQEDRDPRSAGSNWLAHRVGLARFRIFLLRFLLSELDQRHHRYHRFLGREAAVPAVRPKELRPHEAGVACHYPSHLDVMG